MTKSKKATNKKNNLTERETNRYIEKISILKNEFSDGLIDEQTYWENYKKIDESYGIFENKKFYRPVFQTQKKAAVPKKAAAAPVKSATVKKPIPKAAPKKAPATKPTAKGSKK